MQYNESIDAMSCLESFKELYFELLSDIMEKIAGTHPLVRVVHNILFKKYDEI